MLRIFCILEDLLLNCLIYDDDNNMLYATVLNIIYIYIYIYKLNIILKDMVFCKNTSSPLLGCYCRPDYVFQFVRFIRQANLN